MSIARRAIPRPERATLPSLELRYPCPECGKPRKVFVVNVRTDLPLSDRWRDTGPCPRCSLELRWRVRAEAEEYVLEVGEV